jgi:hypothetical protein
MASKLTRNGGDENGGQRSAAVNAALALSAFKVAEPYLKDGYKKLKDKKK